jgi:Na+-translocating ferredoxin:NAD+ oxidoreductase RnfC subunit
MNNKQALTKAPVSGAAERMRRHRQRRREGLRWLRIELRSTEIDMLIAWGHLNEWQRDDPNAITAALYKVFDDIFSVRRRVETTWLSR